MRSRRHASIAVHAAALLALGGRVALILLAFAWTLALDSQAALAAPARFALLIGSNLGDPHEAPLRYAEQDATRLANTLRSVGDFPHDQVVLLTAGTAADVRETLIRLNARVRQHRQAVLFVYFSGHADEKSLHLAGTRFPTEELRGLLVGSPATSRLLVVDACRSGSLTREKGAWPAPSFPVPPPTEPLPEGFAVLTSSAAAEDSQESPSLGGSFFTFFFNSALLGAADQDGDGRVTLSEAYAFASRQTRAATVTTRAGTQNPTFQFMLGGRQDLVLTRPGRQNARLGILRVNQAGRYIVQRWDAAGLSAPLVEIAATRAGTKVALAPGRYRVTLRGERDIAERDYQVEGSQTTTVLAAEMARPEVARVVRKGGPRASATGVVVTGGLRSPTFMKESFQLGAGPLVTAALRHDRRRSSFELRVGLDRSQVSPTRFALTTVVHHGLTATGAWFLALDLPWLTMSGGLELGAVLERQAYHHGIEVRSRFDLPPEEAGTRPRWSLGVQTGPIVQADVPIGTHTFLRFEAGLFFRVFRGETTQTPEGEVGSPFTSPSFGAHAFAAMGVGAAF